LEPAVNMKIRFVKPYRAYIPGDAIEIGGGVADMLIQRRIAVADTQPVLPIETAALEPDATVRTADATPKRRGRR